MRVIVDEAAIGDIDALAAWIATDNPKAARLAKIGSAKLVLPPDQSVQAALREGWPIV